MADISTANVDAGTDDPRAARSQIKEAIDRINTVYAGSDGVVSTGSYVSFAAALAAAAGKTLRVNTAVVVGSDTTIPSTINVEVVRPGAITVNSGQTLTINGDFTAPAQQVFSGAGSVVFGNDSRAASPRVWFGTLGAVYDQRRTILQSDVSTGPVHAYEDNNTLAMTATMAASANAYASFDAAPIVSGAGHYDHHVSFQGRPTYSGSGSIWSRWDGFDWLPTHSGSGTVAAMKGVHIENPLGSGPITSLYGVFVQRLNRGSTDNYGFYSATGLNTISVGSGEAATWLLRGNGQTGGFGLALQSATDGVAYVLQTANLGLSFGTNNTVRAGITAGGLFKISSSGFTDILSGNQRLEVEGSGGATFKANGGAAVGAVLTWNNATSGNNIFDAFYTETSATLRGSIDYNRGSTVVRYNTTSDATLKNDLGAADFGKAVDRLMRVKLHQYAWKEDPEQRSQMGPFAQELVEVMEGAVSVGGEYQEEVNGETVAKYRPWGVDKTAFVWHLVAGFQQQQSEIAALRAEIEALKSSTS